MHEQATTREEGREDARMACELFAFAYDAHRQSGAYIGDWRRPSLLRSSAASRIVSHAANPPDPRSRIGVAALLQIDCRLPTHRAPVVSRLSSGSNHLQICTTFLRCSRQIDQTRLLSILLTADRLADRSRKSRFVNPMSRDLSADVRDKIRIDRFLLRRCRKIFEICYLYVINI